MMTARVITTIYGFARHADGCLTLSYDASYTEQTLERVYKRGIKMADKNAPGALQVVTTPDYEAMFIGAHPDDNDFGAGATSALWARQGKKIAWVVMTVES